jgi:tetratricopeptide (TPR) repeat protein
MTFPKFGGLFRPGLLRITFFAGLPLLILSGGTLIFFSVMGRGFQDPAGGFHRMLRDYDRQYQAMVNNSAYHGAEANKAVIDNSADSVAEKLSQELDRMEKKAGSVDTFLSILKRRRQLAKLYPQYLPAFRQSARRAGAAYPHSDSLTAIAAASLILNTAITRETEAVLRAALPLLSGPRLETLRLCLHVLLGDLQGPQKALANLPSGFSPALIPYSFDDRQAIIADAALIKLIGGSSPAEVQELLADFSNDNPAGSGLSAQTLHFAAEFFYDFGDPLRAARLFSHIPDEQALSRQADSLWLAGYSGSARNIWNIVLNAHEDNYRTRALYNLALSAETREEAAALLRRLVQLSQTLPQTEDISCTEAGFIHYSRFFDAPQATAILEGGARSALIDLELLRRRTEMWESGRSIGAVWLLIDRYPDEENPYKWGAWFFDLQRAYNETAILLKTGDRRQFQDTWMPFHRAFLLMVGGNLDEAEQILLNLDSGGKPGWEIQANLGRIYEARLAPGRALEFYEKAAAEVHGKKDASRIQIRIAQCLKILGRPLESRRVLEYALDLNPDNISARLELSRLEGR